MTNSASGSKSIIEGVEQAVVEKLQITGVRHRSALRRISAFDGAMLVDAIHRTIEANYARGGASANKGRSRENWRWQALQPQIRSVTAAPRWFLSAQLLPPATGLDGLTGRTRCQSHQA